MTVFRPTTSLIAEGTRYTLDNNDLLQIAAGITIGATSNTAIRATGPLTSVLLAGTVIGSSQSSAIVISQGSMTISATGAVFCTAGAGTAGIVMAQGASLFNDGTVTATDGAGINMSGREAVVTNAGTIEGGRGGVVMGLFGTGQQDLSNTGMIIGGTHANSSASRGHGVQIEGDGITIWNAGTILAQGVGKAALHLGTGTAPGSAAAVVITNDGTIRSNRGWAIDGADNLTDGFRLDNSGVISGASGGVRGTDGRDVITNAGRISGGITLDAGNDSYIGGAATHGVTVSAGAGDDNVIGGVSDDQLFGGTNSDTLRAGAGDDTLSGGESADFLFGGLGDDQMTGGQGNDRYNISSLGDVVTETNRAGAGTDRITSSMISLNLSYYDFVEQAVLAGTAALNLIGTYYGDVLIGNAAANRITGGEGLDTMTGGDGADIFVFRSAREIFGADLGRPISARDRITDFQRFEDKIDLSAFMDGAVFSETGLIVGGPSVTFNSNTDILFGSTDGDSEPEWTMFLPGAVITAVDIIF